MTAMPFIIEGTHTQKKNLQDILYNTNQEAIASIN